MNCAAIKQHPKPITCVMHAKDFSFCLGAIIAIAGNVSVSRQPLKCAPYVKNARKKDKKRD